MKRPWYDQPAEIERLLRWLQERGDLVGWESIDFIYLTSKPWKWTGEYEAMVAEEAQAA